MKKCLLSITVIALFMSVNVNAQSRDFNEGQSTVQIGYGIGNFAQGLFKFSEGEPGYSFKAAGPFFLKYEYAVSEKIGIGLNVAVVTANVEYKQTYSDSFGNTSTYTENIDWVGYSFLLRLNQHFGNLEKFDPYWGFGMGYRSNSIKYSNNDPNNSDSNQEVGSIFPFGFEATIGSRYLFTDNFGVYVEAGFAKAVVQFGANIKF